MGGSSLLRAKSGLLVGCGLLVATVMQAKAAFVIAPNSNATTAGGSFEYALFGSGGATGNTFQTAYAPSQFSSLVPGTKITSIGFRLGAGIGTLNTALTYSQFNIQLGQSTAPVGSLNAVFASNLGADTVLARSGALTIAAGSFVGGAGANPFYQIPFTTPYTYTGGTLLVTLRDVFSTSYTVPLDAVVVGVAGTIVDTDGDFSATSTNGTTEFFNAPVIQFGVAAVPEPSSMAIVGVAMLASHQLGRRKHRAATL